MEETYILLVKRIETLEKELREKEKELCDLIEYLASHDITISISSDYTRLESRLDKEKE